jgi:hypothetical protein
MTALLAALLKPVLTLLAAWFSGNKAGRDAAKVEELEAYVQTSKKINGVKSVSDPDAAAEWLRQRAKQRGDL